MLNRGYNGSVNKSKFYSDYNDIDIYVEDTAQGMKSVYLVLFKRIFKDRFKIDTIFPVGGKEAVIRARSDTDKTRKRLFIIDGDFDILNSQFSENKDIYRLKRYSIENYCMDESAILKVLFYENTEYSEDDIIDKLNFKSWFQELCNHVLKITIIYYTAMKKLDNICPKCNDIKKFTDEINGINEKKFHSELDSIINSFKEENIYDFYKSIEIFFYSKENGDIVEIVRKYSPSKKFIIHLLVLKMKSIVSFKTQTNILIIKKIISHCNIEDFNDLEKFIIDLS